MYLAPKPFSKTHLRKLAFDAHSISNTLARDLQPAEIALATWSHPRPGLGILSKARKSRTKKCFKPKALLGIAVWLAVTSPNHAGFSANSKKNGGILINFRKFHFCAK